MTVFRRVACPRLIGRDTELAYLTAALTGVDSGAPAAVFVTGEAGVGKTRLLHEFGGWAAAHGARVWIGRCIPVALGGRAGTVAEGMIPYAPVADLLQGIAADVGADRLRELAGSAAGWLSLLVPELATSSTAAAADSTVPEPAVPPDAHRGRLHAAWWHLLERLAVEPTVVVLEDLHWADASTRDLLAGLASAQLRGRLLVVCTYRDEELPGAHPLRTLVIELVRAGATRLRLAPLDLAHTTEQIAEILRAAPEPGLAERVFARSGGNPFFVEELLASDPSALDLPDSLRDTVLHRMRQLPDAVPRVLRAVALASHDVEHVLLEQMLALPREVLEDALRQAVDRQLLVVRGGRYAFRHALVAEAVLAELLPGERIGMHRSWAAALESHAGERAAASTLAEIAHHWVAAHDTERALRACVRAGVAARRTLAFAEARKQFERAVELWGRAPRSRDRIPLDLVDLYERAAESAFYEGVLSEAIRLVRQAIEQGDADRDPVRMGLLHERLGRYLKANAGTMKDTHAAYEEAVRLIPDTPTPARIRALTGFSMVHAAAMRHGESQRWIERALRIARQIGSPEGQWRALVASGVNLARLGRSGEGIAALEEALAIAEGRERPDEMHAAYCNLSDVLFADGRLADSADLALRGYDIVSRQGVVFTNLLSNALDALFLLGRWEQLADLAENASVPENAAFCRFSMQLNMSTLDIARGRFARARAELLAGHPVVASSVRLDTRAHWSAILSDLQLWEGDPGAARQTVAETLTAMADCDYALPLALLLALGARAEADLAQGGSSDKAHHHSLSETVAALPDRAAMTPLAAAFLTMAEAELARISGDGCAEAWALAAKHWAELSCPFLLAYTRWRQAEALLASRGRRRAAAAVLAEAHRTADRLGAIPLLRQIQRLAARARLELVDAPEGGGDPAPEAMTTAGLTDRETDVLGLLAEGRTNRQIARTLFISENTVSIHVSRILAKLGAGNRAGAAAAAHRLGLLAPRDPDPPAN